MAREFGESASRETQNSFCSGSSNSGNSDAGSFECNICFELPLDPIVTLCGHLYCWPCLFQWLHGHAHSSECPVCKAIIEEDKLVPLYGRGKTSMDPRSRLPPGISIPNRPSGQRSATAPPPDPNQFAHANPWFLGGAPVGTARLGNFTFSAAIGGLFPMLSFQVHGFPDAASYGPAAMRFPHGYHPHGFHGGHAYGYPRQVLHGQQTDGYLKALLIVMVLGMSLLDILFIDFLEVKKLCLERDWLQPLLVPILLLSIFLLPFLTHHSQTCHPHLLQDLLLR